MLANPPHLPGWHNVRLNERLAQAFSGLPVYVEHDGNAGALMAALSNDHVLGQALPIMCLLTFGVARRF